MSLKLLIRITLFGLLLLLPVLAHAQQTNSNYFQTISADKSKISELWYLHRSAKQAIIATNTMRSVDYAYPEGRTLTFYGERTDAEGMPIPEAIAVIPPEASRLLLLFTKLPTPDVRGLSYRIDVIKDDTESFPFGTFHFINSSTSGVDVNLGGMKFQLKQGELKNVPIAPPEKGDLSIKIAQTKDNQSGSKYSNGWGHRANQRTLVFLVDAPNGRLKPLRYRQTEPSQ